MKFFDIPSQTHCYVSGIKLQFAQCLELMYVSQVTGTFVDERKYVKYTDRKWHRLNLKTCLLAVLKMQMILMSMFLKNTVMWVL